MSTTKQELTERPTPRQQLPAVAEPRLPYHPLVAERFGIDKASWIALVTAIFPGATSTESVILALSYCRARNLDPFKRCVHIVPIWDKETKRYMDTVWPGIGELRTTAFRTGEYAGMDAAELGEDVTEKLGNAEITYPEWASVTVHRIVRGMKVSFSGPRVYWKETYAVTSRNDPTPNAMWSKRPRGQLVKCAEAAALRAAFPEEVGGDCIPEEVEGGIVNEPVQARVGRVRPSRLNETLAVEQATEEASEATTDDESNVSEEFSNRVRDAFDQCMAPLEVETKRKELIKTCECGEEEVEVNEAARCRMEEIG